MLVVLARVSEACESPAVVRGFDDGFDDAAELPTDARILVMANFVVPFSLARVDTGEEVATTPAVALREQGTTRLIAYAPTAPLAPRTTYVATAMDDSGTVTAATMTTGDGPASPPAPPRITSISAEPWTPSDGWECVLGSPVEERAVTVHLDLAEPQPVGTLVLLRTDADHGRAAAARVPIEDLGGFTFVQGILAHATDRERVRASCFTPVQVSPSGAEREGEPACVDPDPKPGGCHGGAGAAVALVGLRGLGRRTRARSPAAPPGGGGGGGGEAATRPGLSRS
jgi:hypothetical protein